jgi:hypothetical protein
VVPTMASGGAHVLGLNFATLTWLLANGYFACCIGDEFFALHIFVWLLAPFSRSSGERDTRLVCLEAAA